MRACWSLSLRALSVLVLPACSRMYFSMRTRENLCFGARAKSSSQCASRPDSRRYLNILVVSSSIVFLQHFVVEGKIRCVRQTAFQVSISLAKVLIHIDTGQRLGALAQVQQSNALQGFDAGNAIVQ